MARSRQFAQLQQDSLHRLRARIPSACPLLVEARPGGEPGFRVRTLDSASWHAGRYQVVAAWVDGFVEAWRRVTRFPHPTDSRPPVG